MSSEKAMATHSSGLAWRIPWTEEPGGLPSMGSHTVGHDWSDLAAEVLCLMWASQVALVVKNLPTYQCRRRQRRVWSLSWEDSLEEGMAIRSSITAWRIPWTEDLGGLPSIRSQRDGHDWSNCARTHAGVMCWTRWWGYGCERETSLCPCGAYISLWEENF